MREQQQQRQRAAVVGVAWQEQEAAQAKREEKVGTLGITYTRSTALYIYTYIHTSYTYEYKKNAGITSLHRRGVSFKLDPSIRPSVWAHSLGWVGCIYLCGRPRTAVHTARGIVYTAARRDAGHSSHPCFVFRGCDHKQIREHGRDAYRILTM